MLERAGARAPRRAGPEATQSAGPGEARARARHSAWLGRPESLCVTLLRRTGAARAQVMLKDLADSKRLNAGIYALPAAATSPARRDRRAAAVPGGLSATILSGLFWPPVQARARGRPHELGKVRLNRVRLA